MSIDLGSTSVKCLLVDMLGNIAASFSRNCTTYTGRPGWVEQRPDEWWNATVEAIRGCKGQIEQDIEAISLSGHMSAPVFLDSKAECIYPSIMIADTRSAAQTQFLEKNFFNEFIDLTGNKPLDAFTSSKLLWMKEENRDIYNRIDKFIFPKDFIRLKLAGGIATEATDAGNSLLYNRKKQEWEMALIREIGLDTCIFPELADTTGIFGYLTKEAADITGLRQGIPIVTGASDMACSQIGTGAVTDGILSITLSTSGQVVMSSDDTDSRGIGKVTFHPGVRPGSIYSMGSLYTGGLGAEWGYRLLYNKAKMEPEDYDEMKSLSKQVKNMEPGSGGLLFIPFLTGSGTPYFDTCDRATWLGLALGQEKALLFHSILEGVSYNIRENVEVLNSMDRKIKRVHIGGGGSKDRAWLKIIANILGRDIMLLKNRDASAVGAAILAGVGIWAFPSIDYGVKAMVDINETMEFDKDMHKKYDELYYSYIKIYKNINRYYHGLAGSI